MFTSDLIKRGLDEDTGPGDITTNAIIPETTRARGVVLAKQDLVVAGLGITGGVFAFVDPQIQIQQHAKDGDYIKKGMHLMTLEGNCRGLLRAERVALNFLQRLSGIATLTRSFVERTKEGRTKILDTRKTMPLFRHLDKYAVRMGGGHNHRFGLYDAYMIKDNHIAAVGGSITRAIEMVQNQDPQTKIIVEVTTLKQAIEAKKAGATRLLLDNMSNELIAETLKKVSPIETEISGGITLDRVPELTKLCVDYISVGALTHSAKACDISFEVDLI